MSSKQASSEKELYFSYFIGRCNPPHQGHFHMINGAIESANKKGGKALILLGSGPKAKYGIDRRTEKDPLTFDLKKEIIEKNITNCVEPSVFSADKYEIDEDTYEIVEMTNPTAQVIEFVETELQSQIINDDDTSLIKITVHHFAGAKDNDATKLEFVRRALENKIKEEYNNVDIETESKTESLNSEETNDKPMSATLIREYAYDENNDKEKFTEMHKDLYGEDDAKRVYEAIIEGKQFGEETLKKYTDSKTRKNKGFKSESLKIKKCHSKLTNEKIGGKRKTNKRKTNKHKPNKRRKTNKRKRRKTKRTNKRKNDLNK